MTTRKGLLRRVAPAAMAVVVAACSSSTAATGGALTSGRGGHHATTSLPPDALPLRAGEQFLTLPMEKPYIPMPPSGGTDEYRCLLIDPGLLKPAYLTGSQFAPSNTEIAHHANIYVVAPANAAKAQAKDAASPGQGWTCFGADGLDTQPPSAWVDTWTPGARETLLDGNLGYRIEPGSLVILQIHYNLLATDGKPGAFDQSSVRLRLTEGDAGTKALTAVPLMAPIELPCAPDESGPLCDREASLADVAKRFGPEVAGTETQLVRACNGGTPVPGDTQRCDTPIPTEMTIYAGRGHMHLLGRSIKVELNPGTPGAQVLLDVPEFDFDDQQHVPLPAPVQVRPGDTVRITCTHDAALRTVLPALKKLPPRYVVYGDGTSDEMCIGLMTVSMP
uniref:monooxygenase n=1 Tax=Herbidospora sakaeratensis TaxID=564415 RepID=UPI00078245E0|nr:monooxygenase [Herbidospora sakaeratensis]